MNTVINDIKKFFRSVRFASQGLCHAYRADKSFRMEINYGLPAYLLLGWFISPLQSWEFLFLIFSYSLILIVELVNTAFEKMLDRLHPEEHEVIKRSKDMAAAAVFVSFLFAAIVVGVLIYTRQNNLSFDSIANELFV